MLPNDDGAYRGITSSPTTNISAAATGPAHTRPVTRQAATARTATESTASAGSASLNITMGRSTPLIQLAVAMWAKANQWYHSGVSPSSGTASGKWCFASADTAMRKS
jgi:hypothetical protein